MASIGQISYHFGLHRNTLRNLEARGMVSTPSRTAGNFRDYQPEDVASITCYLDSRKAKAKIKQGDLRQWEQEEFSCEICQKQFPSLLSLSGHKGRVHSGRKH